ncbi:MAG: dynein gamma chain protein, partial [Gordonibacter sp.]|uniref:dynein gamma chain protein n=1 Tax=Gordonibacter sp. TaxID=1968902 RepID=UPI002FC90C9F
RVVLKHRWSHKAAHLAESAGFASVSEKLPAVRHLLADARASLDKARDAFDAGAQTTASNNATVHFMD